MTSTSRTEGQRQAQRVLSSGTLPRVGRQPGKLPTCCDEPLKYKGVFASVSNLFIHSHSRRPSSDPPQPLTLCLKNLLRCLPDKAQVLSAVFPTVYYLVLLHLLLYVLFVSSLNTAKSHQNHQAPKR